MPMESALGGGLCYLGGMDTVVGGGGGFGKIGDHVCAVLCPVCAVEYSMILASSRFSGWVLILTMVEGGTDGGGQVCSRVGRTAV